MILYSILNKTVVMLGYDWWLCMVINIGVVQYNRLASPRHYTVDPRLLPLGNPFKYHVVVVVVVVLPFRSLLSTF